MFTFDSCVFYVNTRRPSIWFIHLGRDVRDKRDKQLFDRDFRDTVGKASDGRDLVAMGDKDYW